MKVAIVGVGSMGQALARGLRQAPGMTVELFDRARDRHELADCDAIVLTVKPKDVIGVVREIALYVKDRLVVSCSAGVSLLKLQQAAGPGIAISRAMPNTAVALRSGTTAIYPANDLVKQLFAAVGQVFVVDHEEEMHVITALSASGPAFVLRFVEAMIAAGRGCGLSAEAARQFGSAAVSATSALLNANDRSIAELRTQIASKGGVTEAGLIELEHSDLSDVVRKAIDAACKRSEQIGESV